MRKLIYILIYGFMFVPCTLNAGDKPKPWVNRYNYQEKDYQFAPRDWPLVYNYQEKSYVFAPRGSVPRYNWKTKKYQMVPRRGGQHR